MARVLPRRSGNQETTMMPQPALADPDLARRRADMADPMVAVLGTDRAITDSEALALLRRRYPHVALCERVAAVGRWRRG
jgi:hypothetical protein